MNEEQLQYAIEMFVEILGYEIRDILKEYRDGKIWRITIVSNAVKKPDPHILRKNGVYVQDVLESADYRRFYT